MYNLTTTAAPFSDFSQIYENMIGENLTREPYIINANFNDQICVSDVFVQKKATNRADSNVAKIEISYRTSNGSDVLTSDGKILVLQSPDTEPIVREQSLRCNIQGIRIKILNTIDQKQPSFVRLEVIGCYAPSKQLFSLKNQIYSSIKYF
jgi:hypothetical protein